MIYAKKVTKIYGENTNNPVYALKNINLDIEEGKFIAIIGRSGSGKTTLLNVLCGLDIPSKGEVFICNRNLINFNEDERTRFRRTMIGFIFQSYNLIPVLNARENIELPQINEDKDYVDDLMKTMDIFDRRLHLPSELSGGQQQRVAICRALVNKPKIIFADEPTGNLDSKSEIEVLELLKDMVIKYNTTIVLITHNLELTKYADEIIVLNDGEIVEYEKKI